jgi:hypothetical protein
MYNILSIGRASLFVMPCLLLDKAFYVQHLTECETMWVMFFIPPGLSFFSIIIVTWKFCFPSVNSTIFLFRKCCHIFDITEFRKKKTPCPGPFIAYTSYILLFSRRLSLCLYHHGWVTLLAFTFWQRICPWHAVCVLHYWYKFQQLDYSSIIINLLCPVVTKIVSECWNIIFVHPHWSFFHHLHTTSVIVSYLTLRILVSTWCHTVISTSVIAVLGIVLPLPHSSPILLRKKSSMLSVPAWFDQFSPLFSSDSYSPKFQTSLQWRDLVVSTSTDREEKTGKRRRPRNSMENGKRNG